MVVLTYLLADTEKRSLCLIVVHGDGVNQSPTKMSKLDDQLDSNKSESDDTDDSDDSTSTIHIKPN